MNIHTRRFEIVLPGIKRLRSRICIRRYLFEDGADYAQKRLADD